MDLGNLYFNFESKWSCIFWYLLNSFNASSLCSSSLYLKMKYGFFSSRGSISDGYMSKKVSFTLINGFIFTSYLMIRPFMLANWLFFASSQTALVNYISIRICLARRLIKVTYSAGKDCSPFSTPLRSITLSFSYYSIYSSI